MIAIDWIKSEVILKFEMYFYWVEKYTFIVDNQKAKTKCYDFKYLSFLASSFANLKRSSKKAVLYVSLCAQHCKYNKTSLKV